jgi:hypothetical protein
VNRAEALVRLAVRYRVQLADVYVGFCDPVAWLWRPELIPRFVVVNRWHAEIGPVGPVEPDSFSLRSGWETAWECVESVRDIYEADVGYGGPICYGFEALEGVVDLDEWEFLSASPRGLERRWFFASMEG